jgi:hypothetical protein
MNLTSHYGTVTRTKPRLRFVKGFDGQQALKLAKSLPIAAGQTPLSGQVVSILWNPGTTRYEWVVGLESGAVPYIADKDYDDPDVQSSNSLQAFPLTSEIEFQSGYFTTGDVTAWNDDASVTAIAFGAGGAGGFKIAGSGDPIVGYLNGGHKGALLDIAGENSNVARDGNGQVLVAQISARFVKGVNA